MHPGVVAAPDDLGRKQVPRGGEHACRAAGADPGRAAANAIEGRAAVPLLFECRLRMVDQPVAGDVPAHAVAADRVGIERQQPASPNHARPAFLEPRVLWGSRRRRTGSAAVAAMQAARTDQSLCRLERWRFGAGGCPDLPSGPARRPAGADVWLRRCVGRRPGLRLAPARADGLRACRSALAWGRCSGLPVEAGARQRSGLPVGSGKKGRKLCWRDPCRGRRQGLPGIG